MVWKKTRPTPAKLRTCRTTISLSDMQTDQERALIESLRPKVTLGKPHLHYSQLSQITLDRSPVPLAVYMALEAEIARGGLLDPLLVKYGFEDGIEDESWVKFETMFAAQAGDLKRLMAAVEVEDYRHLREGGKGWQSRGWVLERTKTERYGQRNRSSSAGKAKRSAIGEILSRQQGSKK